MIKKTILLILTVILCLSMISCGVHDYSGDGIYSVFFTGEEDAEDKELRNRVIAQIESYNNNDAEGYYELFDMNASDRAYNVESFGQLHTACTLTYELKRLETAFINETNAQVLLELVDTAKDKSTDEILYSYLRSVTYTLVKKNGTWLITEQSDDWILGDYTETTEDVNYIVK